MQWTKYCDHVSEKYSQFCSQIQALFDELRAKAPTKRDFADLVMPLTMQRKRSTATKAAGKITATTTAETTDVQELEAFRSLTPAQMPLFQKPPLSTLLYLLYDSIYLNVREYFAMCEDKIFYKMWKAWHAE